VKPAVYTVSAAQAVIHVIRIPGFDRAPPGGDCLREVVWMDGFAGSPAFQFFESLAEYSRA